MLLSYQECLEKYGTDYKIKKCVQKGELYVKEKGIYSDKRYVPELEIISKKYPNAIITLNSAFYYYGLTDTIPDFYYVATPKNTRKISDERVKQFYENSEAFDMGKTKINYDGVDIVIYDKERLLVELIRNKRKFSFDLYKELIASYRKIVQEAYMERLVKEYVNLLDGVENASDKLTGQKNEHNRLTNVIFNSKIKVNGCLPLFCT